jgi:ABC-type uncharacterized transport system ATPase subunit
MGVARLTPAQREEARRLYLSDERLSVDAVAASYGVGRTVMLDVLKGVTRPKGGRPRTSMSTETMIEMRDNGITLEQIGRQAGITRSGVLRRIQRAEEK